MSLKPILQQQIEAHGPIPFEEFMETALYHHQFGFFSSAKLRSATEGDFLTSPEVSPDFGRVLCRWVEREWERLAIPTSMVVVDVGAGSGSLLSPLLEEIGTSARLGSQTQIEVWAVERSPAARQQIAQFLEPGQVVEEIGELPSGWTGVIFANELIDNIPMSVARKTQTGWEELWVGAPSGNEAEMELVAVPARQIVAEWADSYGGEVEVGGIVEVQIGACAWLEKTLSLLAAGSVVVFDYGETASNLEHRRALGTLRTYRNHHLGPPPWTDPGTTDITADVNFTALRSTAEQTGAQVELFRQDEFLASLGLTDLLAQLRSQQLEIRRQGRDNLVGAGRITQIETVLHPRGLGDFRVLVVTK